MTEKNLIYYLVGVEVAYVSTRGPSTTTPSGQKTGMDWNSTYMTIWSKQSLCFAVTFENKTLY